MFNQKQKEKPATDEQVTRHKFKMTWNKSKKWVALSAALLSLTGGLVATGNTNNNAQAQSKATPLAPKIWNAKVTRSFNPPTGGGVNYQYSGTGNVTWSNGQVTNANFMTINGSVVFCINPFVDVFEGANATQAGQNTAVTAIWDAMTPQQQKLVNNITYIGLANNAQNDPNINFAIQSAIWLVESDGTSIPGGVTINGLNSIPTNNVLGGAKITGWQSTGANLGQVSANVKTIVEQAIAMSKDPNFSPNPLTVLAGSSAVTTDTNGVLAGGAGGYGLPFDTIQASSGLTATRNGNDLNVSASTNAVGSTGTVRVANGLDINSSPSYIYGTVNPDGSTGQELFFSKDPSRQYGDLQVKVVGLGKFSLVKNDADTGQPSPQGMASLNGAEFTVYNKDTGQPLKWTDPGLDGHPISLWGAATKKDNTNVVFSLDDPAKGGGVKNIDFSTPLQALETKAPMGYELSTKPIDINFDSKDDYDGSDNNFKVDATATDRPLTFSFMFNKAQDVNGSLTGLNGAEFTATGASGNQKPVVVTSGTATDANGFTVNGVTVFDGKANVASGNKDADGLVIDKTVVTETKTPAGVQAINPFTIDPQPQKDANGNITGYKTVITDNVTHQVIDTIDMPISNFTDNNVMFKVNLGTFTDKPIDAPKPAITTTATDKSDGDKTLGVGQAQVTDLSVMTNIGANVKAKITGTVVYKDNGQPVKDVKGNAITASQNFTADANGDASIRLDFPLIDTTKDAGKDYTVTESVTDASTGKEIVSENDYQNNPSQTVHVATPDGHTEVQTSVLAPGQTTVPDKFFYEGLVKGDTYTVVINQAYDHTLNKVIAVDGKLTFKATASSGSVIVPVKVDSDKYKGHEITFYEDAYPGQTPDTSKPGIISHHDKNDKKETVTIGKPSVTVNVPPVPLLPDTGDNVGNATEWVGLVLLVGSAVGGSVYYFKRRKSDSEEAA